MKDSFREIGGLVMRKKYLVSFDLGYTWEIMHLTDKEVEIACYNLCMVKEV